MEGYNNQLLLPYSMRGFHVPEYRKLLDVGQGKGMYYYKQE